MTCGNSIFIWSHSIGQEHLGITTIMLPSTLIMGQKHKIGCSKLFTKLENSQQSSMYPSYHSHVPSYLHNQPRSIIIHCLDRQTNSVKISAESIHVDCENGIFKIKNLKLANCVSLHRHPDTPLLSVDE